MKNTCAYCGVVADSIDHVVPQWFIKAMQNSGVAEALERSTVHCCRECNSLIGGKIFDTFRARKSYALDRLLVRYKKVLATPAWNRDQIEVMGPSMRSFIYASLTLKAFIALRLAFGGKRSPLRQYIGAHKTPKNTTMGSGKALKTIQDLVHQCQNPVLACGKCGQTVWGEASYEITTGVFTHVQCPQRAPKTRKNPRRMARLLMQEDS